MPRTRQNFITAEHNAHAHYVLDGMKFNSIQQVYVIALGKGFNGAYGAIAKRLTHGCDTWKKLLEPVDTARSEQRKEIQRKKHEEMHRICEELDARKKELGYAY
jgi:hypothetical protein